MIRLLVTGRQGQLARSLADRMQAHPGTEVLAVGRPQLDLEDPSTVARAIGEARPDIVVNAAAYTAVDKAEQEPERALAVNCDGAGIVAREAAMRGVPLIHLSTDYVYSGDKAEPYVESDPVAPLGVYGRSKLEGERAVRHNHPAPLILRTAWVYSPFGHNFVKTMLRLGRERDELRVVADQIGNPTSALDLADAILRLAPRLLAGQNPPHTLHLCGSGSVTWHGFADYVFTVAAARGQPRPRLVPIQTSAYPTPARRPVNSRLDCSAFLDSFGFLLPPWKRGIDETVARLV